MSFVTEQPCLCFEIKRESQQQSFGLQIAGGLDQDANQNPFKPGDTGIFIASIESESLAEKNGL